LAAIPFGHALVEKLLTPYKAITAHVWPIGEGEVCFETEREKRTSKKLDRNIHAGFRAKASGKAHEYYGQAFLNTPVNPASTRSTPGCAAASHCGLLADTAGLTTSPAGARNTDLV
jgi:hypothetical protein